MGRAGCVRNAVPACITRSTGALNGAIDQPARLPATRVRDRLAATPLGPSHSALSRIGDAPPGIDRQCPPRCRPGRAPAVCSSAPIGAVGTTAGASAARVSRRRSPVPSALHQVNAEHVDDEVVVAEARCRVRTKAHFVLPASAHLVMIWRISWGARNCGFLDVDDLAGARDALRPDRSGARGRQATG